MRGGPSPGSQLRCSPPSPRFTGRGKSHRLSHRAKAHQRVIGAAISLAPEVGE